MQHRIPVEQLGPMGEPMAEAVQACVHCGFCLSACPTYAVLGQEMDSPRGRIYLMKGVLEGDLPLDQAMPHIDQCLGCLACEPACPSGVAYHQLLSPFRQRAEEQRRRPMLERLRRWLILQTLPYPKRLRWAARFGRLMRPLQAIAPRKFAPMFELMPTRLPAAPAPLPALSPAQGRRRARVAMLTGCAQQVLDPGINAATIDVLTRNGVEVIVPQGQACCGALAWHVGARDAALRMARVNLAAFPDDVDAIVTNAAGCGSGMHDYALMFRGSEHEAQARALAGRVVDVSVLLDRVGFQPPPDLPRPLRVAYHDACHLAQAQGVRAQPRRLLEAVGNLTLLELAESDMCCGSAGTYNLDQPVIAAELGARKAANVLRTSADVVVTGNIGCMVQMRLHLERSARTRGDAAAPPRVMHTMQLLASAYDGAPI